MPAQRIPWIDLLPQTNAIRQTLFERWQEILDTGDFSGGAETARFEQEWAAYVGAAHAVGCSDGTLALTLLLRASGIGPGDEVLTAPTSYFATAEAIALSGAIPSFADVDEETGNLDPESVVSRISSRTRAILAVHLSGRPAPMQELSDVARRHGLRLFEDAAQAHGAEYHGRRAGALGDGAGFSFYPTKNLGAFGEAGAVTTGDDDLATRARALREHGQGARHRHSEIGFNSRLDGLQAAVLRLKVKHLDTWNAERRRIAALYRSALAGSSVGLPPETPGDVAHVYHLFTVRTPRRDSLGQFLSARGIGTGSHYPTPIHLQPAFAALGHVAGDFPRAERYAAQQLSLPIYPGLPDSSVRAVSEAIRDFFGG